MFLPQGLNVLPTLSADDEYAICLQRFVCTKILQQ